MTRLFALATALAFSPSAFACAMYIPPAEREALVAQREQTRLEEALALIDAAGKATGEAVAPVVAPLLDVVKPADPAPAPPTTIPEAAPVPPNS